MTDIYCETYVFTMYIHEKKQTKNGVNSADVNGADVNIKVREN